MQLYLPIAELSVNVLLMIGIGAAIGFVSGLLGVGGGFLLTPLLIFTGIPTAVAVGTGAAQVVASSSSAAMTYARRKQVDLKLAGVLIAGGVVGSAAGVALFNLLQASGQLDLFISIAYVGFLGIVGGLMLVESVRTILRTRRGQPTPLRKVRDRTLLRRLPWQTRFRRSHLHISVIPVIALGFGVGVLGALLGVGGGFIVVPALIYLFRVPTSMVIGTSLVQILGTMTATTILHAVTSNSVDAILALILMVGSVIGAQFGVRWAVHLRGETLRLLLAVLVLAVATRFLVDLVTPPQERYSIEEISA